MRTSDHAAKSAATSPSAERPTWIRWQIVALLMALSFMSWFNRVSLTVADRPIMEEFDLSSTQIGNIDSTLLLVYMLCMTPGGWLIDRVGPRRALMVMGFGTAIFVGLSGLGGRSFGIGQVVFSFIGISQAFFSFLVIRAGLGCFSAPIYPASAKMVSHWIPFSKRAWANGLITGAAPVGMAASHVVFGYLMDHYTWRNAFFITGSFTALLAVIWTCYATNYPSQHRFANEPEQRLVSAADPVSSASQGREAGLSVWQLLQHNRSLVLLTISYAAVGYFEYLFNFCSEFYFKRVLNVPEDLSRWYSACPNLAQAVAMPLGGLFSDLLVRRFGYRIGRASMPVLGMLASAAWLHAATLTRDPIWTLIWFTLANGAIGATEGAFWTTAVELGGVRGGITAGIVNTGGNAGGMLAPSITRGLGDLGYWRLAFYIGSLVCLVGAALWWWIDPRQRVPETEEPKPPSLPDVL
jgi:MFS family permease